MSIAKVFSRAQIGVNAPLVTIEVHLSSGLPSISIVGLPEADMVCAITMNYVEEAVGIARAAQQAHMPVAISFTVEADGKLPTGQTLKAAIEQIGIRATVPRCSAGKL